MFFSKYFDQKKLAAKKTKKKAIYKMIMIIGLHRTKIFLTINIERLLPFFEDILKTKIWLEKVSSHPGAVRFR